MTNHPGFPIDLNKAKRLAGIRVRPWPRSRKRLRKVRRQHYRRFNARLTENAENMEILHMDHTHNADTGISGTVTEYRDKRDGEIKHLYSVDFGTAASYSQELNILREK